MKFSPQQSPQSRPRARRVATTIALATSVAIILGACATGSAAGGGQAQDGVVTLNGDRADFVDGFTAAGIELEAAGASTIEPRNVPSTENYQQVIRSSLKTSSTTDLLKWWSGYRLQDLARSGGLANLDSAWDTAVENGWVNPETKSSFSYDGTVYGIPMYKSYWVIYYNKNVFAEVGITPPATWDEFMSNNEKIKAAGVAPMFATQEAGWTSFIWFEEILSKLDPEFYVKLMNGEASYTDAPAQEALEIWSDLYAKGYFTAPDVAWDNEPALFQEGAVAQVPMGTWRNGTFVANGMTEKDYGAYILPVIKEGVAPSVITESGVIAVAEKAPNKDEAIRTMSEWLNPDVQDVWVNSIKDTSANPNVVTNDPTLTSVTEQVAEIAPIELERYWEASPPALIETAVQHLGAFMVNPSKDNILPTLEKMQAIADTEWAKWRESE
ncbi:MAG: ABC transporter substrate-binding protein [Rhodoglobus sp.]